MKRHSFVIPVYKQSPYLKECIECLLAQTVPSAIVLTTSTSPDYTRMLAEQFGLRYCINERKNAGIAGDWNFALESAASDWVTIAHQDDLYLPEFAEQVVERMQRFEKKGVQIVFTDYLEVVNGADRGWTLNALVKSLLLLPFKFSSVHSSSFMKKSVLMLGDPICCPAVTFNKSVTGNFKFSEELLVALDWLAWIDLAEQKGAFVFVNKKLMKHRIHLSSETTVQIDNGTRKREELMLFERLWGKRLAGILSKVYAIAQKQNSV